MGIIRNSIPQKGVTIGTSVAASQAIPYQNVSGGHVSVPVGSSLTLLTWYSAATLEDLEAQNFLPIQDGAGNPVASTVSAGVSCPIPSTLFGCYAILAVGSAAGCVHLNLKT